MNIKKEEWSKLRKVGESICINIGPLIPCMLMAFNREGSPLHPEKPSEVEFGFSGFQTVSSNTIAEAMMREQNWKPYALEGVGYMSISKELVESSGEKELSPNSSDTVSELAMAVLASWIVNPPTSQLIIQLSPSNLPFPETHVGVTIHAIAPCTEEHWIALMGVHMNEIQAAQLYRSRINGDIASGVEIRAGDLSKTRVLN